MNSTTILNTMTHFKSLLSTFLFLSFFTVINAQSQQPIALLASNDLTPKATVNDDWTFFYDEENKIYYIDFETIKLNLTDVNVKNNDGKAIISDKVADLPVNTIYELDCHNLKSGDYTIELHSYTKVLTKDIKVK